MLLRLTPGPAEARFGITAAPMAAVADGYGRLVAEVESAKLRGAIPGAVRHLEALRRSFDPRAAARKPYEAPRWASPLLADDAEAAVALLDSIHPRRGRRSDARRKLSELATVYRSLEVEAEKIRFARGYIAACVARAPAPGEEYPGHGEETDLLAELTDCGNDKVKFEAIEAFGRFAPLSRASFFAERAARRTEGCRNPNVVLCRCLTGLGLLAARHPGISDRRSVADRDALLAALPFPAGVLETQARNNGACAAARDAIRAIYTRTGAVDALRASLACFRTPGPANDWMQKMNERFLAETRKWLVERTGVDHGTDLDAWSRWVREKKDALFYDAQKDRILVDTRLARAFAHRIEAARKGR